jgi:ribosome biogenesis ATPase
VLGLSLCKFLYKNYEIPFKYVSATEITGGISGESENNLRTLFQTVQQDGPSVLFIDELDAIAGKKDNAAKDMEKRVVI